MKGYSAEFDPEKTSKAIGKELNISPKASLEVCRKIRHMMAEDAVELLEKVVALEQPIRYHRYCGQTGHRKGKGFGAGRYPKKAAKEIIEVIRNAQHNAEYKGLDSEKMKIAHISAYKGRVIEGYMPRAHGRSSPSDHYMTNIEIILEVVEE
jgi:large subunit ribosomal protein L22